ncbi:MAG: RNA polymerase sigma factor [Verrucomicrobiales bacterium]
MAFLRRDGRSEDAAREMAHGFFEWLLMKDRLASLDRERARFRSYLLGALKHYLSHRRERAERLKRGGGKTPLPLEEAPEFPDMQSLPPDREFDRQWALHVIRSALERLESDWQQAVPFVAFRPFLTAESVRGDLSELAKAHQLNENTVRGLLSRLRKKMRQEIRAQVAETLPSLDQLDDEMQSLFDALGDG